MHPPGRQRHDAKHAAARPRAGVVPPAGRTHRVLPAPKLSVLECTFETCRERSWSTSWWRCRRVPGWPVRGARSTSPGAPTDELVDVLRAQSRQCAHEQRGCGRRSWRWAWAVRSDELPDGSSDTAGMAWASSEVAAALTWTSRTADRELDLAQVVVRALPKCSPRCGPGTSTGAKPSCSQATSTRLRGDTRSRRRRSAPGCCRSRRS